MILALDPGLAACGWALFDDGALIDFGVITTAAADSKAPVAEQDIARARGLMDLISGNVRKAGAALAEGDVRRLGRRILEAIYLEGFTAARGYRAAKAQALVLGAIAGLAREFDSEVRSVSPARVKKLADDACVAAQATVKPLRVELRDIDAQIPRAVTQLDRTALEWKRDAVKKQLAPLERARAKAEKGAIIDAVIALHPAIEDRLLKFKRHAEHAADAIAIYHAAADGPVVRAPRLVERQGSLL